MGKVEANNEIIRMRRLVRQARVCVIHKLTREVKTLRMKHGTEKQQEKNKRKADKLISEIHALKKIKVDCITKFGIANKKSLQEILQTKNVKENIRIMARVTDNKALKNAIIKFRETYPNYEEYLQPGKKKSAKPKIKSQEKQNNNTEITKESRLADEPSSDQDLGQNNDSVDDDDGVNSKHSDIENDLEQHNSEPGSILRIKPLAHTQTGNKKNVRLKRNRKKSIESIEEHDDVYNNSNSKDVKKARETLETDKEQKVKIISKQATVKRFTELLQEQSTEESSSLKKRDEKAGDENKSESGKQIDSFFMCGDGDAYLSVAQTVIEENKDSLDDDDRKYNNRSRGYTNKKAFTNDKFFSNVKSVDTVTRKGKHKESWQNDKGFIENKSSFRKQKNVNTSSFNNLSKKRSNDTRVNLNESENLHPSWLAKKKQQEIVKQGFQGKKIVFDDD